MENLRDAEPLLIKLLQAVPKHHSARLELGSLYEQQSRFDEAIAQYKQIPPGSADYWRAESQIAQILTAEEKFDQAETHHQASLNACRKRAAYKPAEGAQILIRWATNDLGRQRYAAARAKLREAIELIPNYSVPYRELGFVLYKERRQQEAIASLERSANLNPDDPITYRYMGATWAVLGDWNKAADAFRKALLLYPSDAESLDGLITVLLKLGRYDEVILEVEDAIASRPDDTLHVPFLLGLGEALSKRGEWERAIATFRRAVDLSPDSLDAVNQLAWTLATTPDDRFRNGPEANEVAQPLEKDESNSIYFDTIAAVRAENGRWDEAIDWENKAITAAQKNSQPTRIEEFKGRLSLYQQKQPFRTPAAPAASP
jgi:tetratricopeptide (TPR) repeat protein